MECEELGKLVQRRDKIIIHRIILPKINGDLLIFTGKHKHK